MTRTWLVTGSSRGFGRALCEAILDAGDNLLATARDPDQLAGLGDGRPGKLATARLDVTSEEDATATVAKAITAFGALDILLIGRDCNGSKDADGCQDPEQQANPGHGNHAATVRWRRRAITVGMGCTRYHQHQQSKYSAH